MTETPKQSPSWGSWLAGITLGAIAGLTVAMLYAPRPGKETREELMQRLDDLKERLDEMSRTVSEAAKARLAETTADLSQAIEASRKAAAERAAELRRQTGLE